MLCALSNGAVFDDLEWSRTPVSRSHYSLKANISQTVHPIHSMFGSRLGFSGSAEFIQFIVVQSMSFIQRKSYCSWYFWWTDNYESDSSFVTHDAWPLTCWPTISSAGEFWTIIIVCAADYRQNFAVDEVNSEIQRQTPCTRLWWPVTVQWVDVDGPGVVWNSTQTPSTARRAGAVCLVG